MTGAAWRLELWVALRRRRLLALNAGIPLLLVLPVALGGAPAVHAAVVYTVLFVLFGTFGSAIPLIRDGESGFLARLRDTGIDDRWHLLERTATATAVDVVELLPTLAVIAILEGGQTSRALAAGALLLPVLALSLLVANVVGAWVAGAARSLAESALFTAGFALLLLHGSGVFRTPAPRSIWAAVERWAPFRALHEGLLALARGEVATLAPPGGWTPLLRLSAVVGCLLFLTALAATWILRRIASPPRS